MLPKVSHSVSHEAGVGPSIASNSQDGQPEPRVDTGRTETETKPPHSRQVPDSGPDDHTQQAPHAQMANSLTSEHTGSSVSHETARHAEAIHPASHKLAQTLLTTEADMPNASSTTATLQMPNSSEPSTQQRCGPVPARTSNDQPRQRAQPGVHRALLVRECP